jgi:hypothetical protein
MTTPAFPANTRAACTLVGRLLFGHGWRIPLASALGIDRRVLTRMLTQDAPLTPAMLDRLRAALHRHAVDCIRVREAIPVSQFDFIECADDASVLREVVREARQDGGAETADGGVVPQETAPESGADGDGDDEAADLDEVMSGVITDDREYDVDIELERMRGGLERLNLAMDSAYAKSSGGTPAEIVERCLSSSLPDGATPFWSEISRAKKVGAGRNLKVIGDVVMFDGLKGTVEVSWTGPFTGHRWVQWEGDDVEWDGTAWRRVDSGAEVVELASRRRVG